MAARAETKDLDQEERRAKMTELNKEINESTSRRSVSSSSPSRSRG